ncbi:MAG TPA: hypothetical protein PKM41_09395 [Deltaproteobacteria bacterium]|jgi:hypothetical protein|nr:hypothetical protein [Deltaproteobacteria bacterium]HOI08570.1 hypothetical protein [Deltaproteobacteria bacterium]
MNTLISSLSCVDGKDSSLPRLLDLITERTAKPVPLVPQVLKGLVRLIGYGRALIRA